MRERIVGALRAVSGVDGAPSPRRVWLDVTDVTAWSGHFTGTQRVTYEVVVRFVEHHPRARLLTYDSLANRFFEASTGLARPADPPEQASRGTADRTPADDLLGGVVTSIVSVVRRSLPVSVRGHLRGLRHRRDIVKARVAVRLRVTRPVSFGAQDVVVLLGTPWDSAGLLDGLEAQKARRDFRLVHLIHDMIPTKLPQLFGEGFGDEYASYMSQALRLTDHVVAVSRSTERDIAEFCAQNGLAVPSVTVTELGDSLGTAAASADGAVAGLIAGEFILSVGTVEVRKNHRLLYMAYREAHARGIAMPKLVIVGGAGYLTSDLRHEMRTDPATQELINVLPGVSDMQLAWLYANCRFTVYPSVYEGWGLPIAESLARGKLCVASGVSSMTEIAGDLLDYFSPYDSGQCLEQMVRYLDDARLAEKEAEIARTYVRKTWDRTFDDVVRALSG